MVKILELDMNTFGRDLQLAALGNLDFHLGTVGGGGSRFNLFNDIVALENFAKDNVSAVKPSIFNCVRFLIIVSPLALKREEKSRLTK
jgi:hypothetical protein